MAKPIIIRGGEKESVHIITVLRSYHTAIARFSIKIRIKRYGCLDSSTECFNTRMVNTHMLNNTFSINSSYHSNKYCQDILWKVRKRMHTLHRKAMLIASDGLRSKLMVSSSSQVFAVMHFYLKTIWYAPELNCKDKLKLTFNHHTTIARYKWHVANADKEK